MKTTVQALQDVYIQLGGALTDTYAGIAGGVPVGDYTAIPDMVEAVSKKASSGGGGSGGDICFLHATISGQTAVLEESADEVVAAYKAGKLIIIYDGDGAAYIESYVYYDAYDETESLTLYFDQQQVFASKTGINHLQIQIYWENDGTFDVTLNASAFTFPSYTKSDAGKVLGVDSDGKLEWKTLN